MATQKRMAVVHPHDALALKSAVESRDLVEPILVGDAKRIVATATRERIDIKGMEIISVCDPARAVACAVDMAKIGSVQTIMKGSLHSDVLLHAVAQPDSGLHTGRRLSHAFVLTMAGRPEPFVVSDAVVNIAPALDEKRDIAQNAIDLARAIGMREILVAVLAAVETVNDRMVSTIDAAALSKMADRRQLVGAVVDGPLAFDDAIDLGAVQEKEIVSRVAGRANVLIVPDIESGNIVVKALILLGKAAAAGVVLGATIPIVLTSRADSVATHVGSVKLALRILEQEHLHEGH